MPNILNRFLETARDRNQVLRFVFSASEEYFRTGLVRDFDDESILIEDGAGEEHVILRRFLHLVIPEWHEFALLRFKRAA
jgi:hypothetical protein